MGGSGYSFTSSRFLGLKGKIVFETSVMTNQALRAFCLVSDLSSAAVTEGTVVR